MNIQNDKIQNDPQLSGLGAPPQPLEAPVSGQVAPPKVTPVIIDGPSVVVTRAGGGIDAMVAKLKAERDNVREDYARTQLATALSAVLDRIQIRDGELQKIVDDLKVKNGELARLQTMTGQLEAAIDTTKAQLTDLQIKTKQIEAEIEALKKTPEEKQKEIEFKEKLAKLERVLTVFKHNVEVTALKLNTLERNLTMGRKMSGELANEINDLLVKLDALSRGAVTQALRDLGIDVEDVVEPEGEKKSGKVDGMPALLRLLAGAKQRLSDAVEERSPKMV